MSDLFSPLVLNSNLTAKNRIVMSPMCQYSGDEGFALNYHLIHLGSRAMGGAGIVIQEATAVSPEGRISIGDLGIWRDEQITKMKEITNFIKECGSIPGIQLAHAGRKGSYEIPWVNGGKQLSPEDENGWQTISSSDIPYSADEYPPKALKIVDIDEIIESFVSAAQRSILAGYEVIEIHAAHGYLIHQFLSPLVNNRTDGYGGSFENRIRLLLEVIDGIKPFITTESLWVRISATDWAEGGWTLEESIQLATILEERGIDVLDVSSGGLVEHQKITVEKNYQVPFAEAIKKVVSTMKVGTVGLIVEAAQAEALLNEKKADLIFLGRELLFNPYFPLHAALELDGAALYPDQYKRISGILRYKDFHKQMKE